jgi:hypothetical protein
MGYPEPLRQLRQSGVIEPQARFFCKNAAALLVCKGNPLRPRKNGEASRSRGRAGQGKSGYARSCLSIV